MSEREKLLFLAPTFLMYRLHKQIRGVEVFDLLLVRQLVELGHQVTLIADRTWRERFEAHLADAMPDILYTPGLRKLWLNAPFGERLIREQTFDAIIVGNNARGLLPTVKRLIARRASPRVVLIANRPPRPDYAKAAHGMAMDVTAVNPAIATMFEGVVDGRVETRYGIPNAALFFADASAHPDDGIVRFVMLGRMDTPLKRAERAIASFARLPSNVRNVCELHLASYPTPPRDLPKGVVPYPWMELSEIADLLKRMDVFIGLSDHETFCQAMVQAMLTQLPSIVNTVPALVEKTERGGGVVVRDDDELDAAITKLATDASLRASMGVAARTHALDAYVWNTEQWLREQVFLKREPTTLPA